MADVTVGFPVYNGAIFIAQSLECILQGTYADVKVIVSDNGSSDGTVEIVQSFAERDDRIRLIQQPENLGAVGNFRFVVQQADTPYFLWRAHDDLSDENFIEVLRDSLQASPNAVLAAPYVVTSKPRKRIERPFTPRLTHGKSADWRSMLHVHAGWIYGLYRTEYAAAAVDRVVDNFLHVRGWDLLMILDALLAGGVTGSNETKFIHQQLETTVAAEQVVQSKSSPDELRVLAGDFYRASNVIAEAHHLSGFSHLYFRALLLRYITKRLVRLNKLVF